jgi:hypothetical protein
MHESRHWHGDETLCRHGRRYINPHTVTPPNAVALVTTIVVQRSRAGMTRRGARCETRICRLNRVAGFVVTTG